MSHLTLEDVAGQTAVPCATVSRGVSGCLHIHEDVRQSAPAVIQIVSYHLHIAARAPASLTSQVLKESAPAQPRIKSVPEFARLVVAPVEFNDASSEPYFHLPALVEAYLSHKPG